MPGGCTSHPPGKPKKGCNPEWLNNSCLYKPYLDAIKALAIDVPIMRTEQDENGAVTIYLYGGAVHHWPPEGELTIQKITDPFPYDKAPRDPHRPAKVAACQKVADKSLSTIRVHPLLSVSICVIPCLPLPRS